MAYRKIKKDGTPAKATKALQIDEATFVKGVNEYIALQQQNNKPILLKELALLLGISDDTLTNYRQNRRYSEILKKVDIMAENYWVTRGNEGKSPLFPMFMLKARHGYVEQQYQKVDFNVHGQIGIVQMPPLKKK